MNVIAKSVGAHGTPLSILASLGHTLRAGGTLRRARHTTIRSGARLGLLWGVGLFANFLEVYQQQRGGLSRALGLLAGASLGALTGHSLVAKLFEPFAATVTVDGVAWGGASWTNLSAGGVAGLGFGFDPYIRATERSGCFHLIGHALGPFGALRELPRLRAGLGMKNVTQDVARHVVVETEQPRIFGMDGEVFERATHFEIHAGPEIELVLPAATSMRARTPGP